MTSLSVNASITLTQTNPDAPSFMTVCARLSDDISTYSGIIHSFGEVVQNGKRCESFGPHYNPFGVSIFHILRTGKILAMHSQTVTDLVSTGCPNNNCFFSRACCSYKSYPILGISSLLGWQWNHFYVGIICNNISSFWYSKCCLKWWALFFLDRNLDFHQNHHVG